MTFGARGSLKDKKKGYIRRRKGRISCNGLLGVGVQVNVIMPINAQQFYLKHDILFKLNEE